VFFLFPLYIMVITSLKDLDAIRAGNLFTPSDNMTIAPWIKAWSQACTGLYCEGIKPGFINSLKITIPSVIVSITVACITGYSLANWPFKYSEAFFTILLLASFIPYVVMLYPIVIITRWLGIFSTLAGRCSGAHHLRHAASDAAFPQLFRVAAARIVQGCAR
jgi:glucose/mannose transport system permease protein